MPRADTSGWTYWLYARSRTPGLDMSPVEQLDMSPVDSQAAPPD